MDSGAIIKRERERRGWSQEKLAKEVGISQPAIKKIEAGATRHSKFLPQIFAALDLPLEGLMQVSRKNSATVRDSTITELHTISDERLLGKEDLQVFGTVQGGRGGPSVVQ